MQAHMHYDLVARFEEWERSEERQQPAEPEVLEDPFEGATPLPNDDPFQLPPSLSPKSVEPRF